MLAASAFLYSNTLPFTSFVSYSVSSQNRVQAIFLNRHQHTLNHKNKIAMSSPLDSLPNSPLATTGQLTGDSQYPLNDDSQSVITPLPTSRADQTADMDADLSDNDSVLSDVDEAQFEDFDPANLAIDERPAIAVDEDNVKLLGRHKRKRDPGEGPGDGVSLKKKGKKREKPSKLRKKRDEDDNFSGGEELEGKRIRKKKALIDGSDKREKPKARKATPENEDELDPAER